MKKGTYSIIGGGIAGLTTALMMEKHGIPYHVYERSPELREVGAGIWLAPNALQVLQYLGLLEVIKKNGNSIDRVTVGRSDLSPITDQDQTSIKEQYGFSSIAIHRATLQRMLFDCIPEGKISLDRHFDFFNEAEGELSIKFKSGHKAVSDYMIAADGVHSAVRKQIFPQSTIRYSGQTCWRGVSDYELPKDYQNRGVELWGSQLRFGFSKIAKGKVYWFAVALSPQNGHDNPGETKSKLLTMYQNYDAMIRAIINDTPGDQIMRNDIIDLKPMKSWYSSNVCLIGDAGHATTPNMGQGGAQAIEDAYFLVKELIEADGYKAFERFQNNRIKKVNGIVNESWKVGKIAHWKHGSSIRNLLLGSIPNKMIEKKMMQLYQLG